MQSTPTHFSRFRCGFGYLLLSTLIALIVCRSVVFAERTVAGTMSVGMNLNMLSDYDPAWVFTDVFLQSRPWIAHAYDAQTGQEVWGAGGALDLDERGWPRQLRRWVGANGRPLQQRLATLMYREIGDHYPSGVYRAEWRGTGEVEWGFAAKELRRGRTRDGRHVADLQVTPDEAGIYFKILSLDSEDPIRDVHLWLPASAAKDEPRRPWLPTDSHLPFADAFLERLGPFQAVRFMDWGRTNVNSVRRWEERTQLGDARQTDPDRGVAIEYMVALANALHQDAWINLPLQADDDYVRNLATYARDHLLSPSKLYVEWSNENWNYAYGFQGARWIDEQLKREGQGVDARWLLAARETRRDFAICREVFRDQPERLVRVVAGQAANVNVAAEQLAAIEGELDAIAVAAYFYLPEDASTRFSAHTTVDDLLDGAEQTLPRTIQWIERHKQLADDYAIKLKRPISLVVYEGGQHFETQGQKTLYLPVIYAAQSHPRMERLYDQLLDGCRRAGVSLFMHYAYAAENSAHGCWGAMEYQDAPLDLSPKYRALVRAAAQHQEH